jgi:hypothetical protein
LSDRASWIAVLLVCGGLASLAAQVPAPHVSVAADTRAPAPSPSPRMITVPGKDVNGTIYKKLGLPDRHYCWDMCLKEEHCSGVRWGSVAGGGTAGLCLFMTGPLTFKDLVDEPRTEDGKAIHVTVARKDVPPGTS